MFNRAYTGFANKLRMDIFAHLIENAGKQGLKPSKNPKLAKSIAEWVNVVTGRGSIGTLESKSLLLNTFLFAPRFVISRLQMLNPKFYVKLEPYVRKEALKTLFAYTSNGLVVLALSKVAGADVGLDPRSSDFGKIIINKTRLDIWGGMQQYIVLAARLLTGELVSSATGQKYKLGEGYKSPTYLGIISRALEYKGSPIFTFATGMLRGTTVIGEKFEISKEVARRFVPIIIEDIVELAKEDPKLLPAGILGMFGVGLQTYGEPISKGKLEKKYEKFGRFTTIEKRLTNLQKLEKAFGKIGER
jgi:hypothetical protein